MGKDRELGTTASVRAIGTKGNPFAFLGTRARPPSNYCPFAQVGLYLLQAASPGLWHQEVDEDRRCHADAGEDPEDRRRAYERAEREEGLRDHEVGTPVAERR